MSELTCVVLAGGLGTRLKSAVPDRPKCLAPVGERSFLEIQLDSLHSQGATRFVLSLGHLAEQVLEAVKGFKLSPRIDCVTETSPLGTGGALQWAFKQAAIQEAWVVNGDTFLEADLSGMRRPLALADGECMRMAVVAVDDCGRYGGVVLDGGRVSAFTEKGQQGPGLINAGLYRVHASAFAHRQGADAYSMETDLMPRLLAAGALKACTIQGEFIDIGIPADYRRFCDRHLKQA